MRCDEFRELMPAYLDETIDEARRPAWREHLKSCSACRQQAVAEDPTLLFVAMSETAEPDGDAIEACVDRVTASIRQQRLEARLRPRSQPWLAAAAGLVLAVGGWALWQLAPDGENGLQPTPGVVPVVDTGEIAPPPRVEVDMEGEGIRVYRYADDVDDGTAVVFIVNPAVES